MSNQSFDDIQTGFDNLLATLATGDDKVVEEVVWGRKQLTAGSIGIRYFIANVDSRHVSQHDYQRGIAFQIDIVQDLAQKDEGDAETELGNALWALFDLLEDQWDLDSNIIDDPTSSTSEKTDEDGRVVVASVIAKPRTFNSYGS